jgi:hypothetical protein
MSSTELTPPCHVRKTIDLLKEQTELMRHQGETREREWRRLEQTWHEREARLEKRIEGVEGDYRRLVLTVTSMGLCANAPECANYNLESAGAAA